MLNGYSYNEDSSGRFYCLKKNRGCKARVKLDEMQMITYAHEEHAHPPVSEHSKPRHLNAEEKCVRLLNYFNEKIFVTM